MKYKYLKLGQRDAVRIWRNLNTSMVSYRIMSDLFDIAFPNGTKDKLYKQLFSVPKRGKQ